MDVMNKCACMYYMPLQVRQPSFKWIHYKAVCTECDTLHPCMSNAGDTEACRMLTQLCNTLHSVLHALQYPARHESRRWILMHMIWSHNWHNRDECTTCDTLHPCLFHANTTCTHIKNRLLMYGCNEEVCMRVMFKREGRLMSGRGQLGSGGCSPEPKKRSGRLMSGRGQLGSGGCSPEQKKIAAV